jgi:lysophospholipase L1-like esterase
MDRTWLYAGLIVAGGAALMKVLGQGPTLRRGERLLLVGDSLSVGLAPPLGQLAKDNGVLFDAVGQVGTTVGQWATPGGALNTALRQKLALKPAVVLVSLGTNDEALTLASAQKELGGIDALVTLVRGSGALIGWIGPPKFLPGQSFKPNGFTAAIRQKVPAKDYFPSEAYDIPRGGDNLHPTVRGYAGWAGQIWQWLHCCSA